MILLAHSWEMVSWRQPDQVATAELPRIKFFDFWSPLFVRNLIKSGLRDIEAHRVEGSVEADSRILAQVEDRAIGNPG